MKLILRFGFVSLILVLLSAMGVSLYYGRQLNEGLIKSNQIYKEDQKDHYVLIYNDEDSIFWDKFLLGVKEGSQEESVDVEINKVTGLNKQSLILEYIDIAIASKVDGIIIQAVENVEFIYYINKAITNGIPVITVENDCIKSDRISYVGTNAYETGKKAGELVQEAIKGNANIVTIVQDDTAEVLDISSSNLISGLSEVINLEDNMKLLGIEKSSHGLLSAEDIAYKIINTYPTANAIICTSARDTLGVASVLIDFNKVGEIQIIGYDVSDEMISYIEKGIVYGTIARNPEVMGKKSIQTLSDIKNDKVVSDFIDTGITVYTKNTIK